MDLPGLSFRSLILIVSYYRCCSLTRLPISLGARIYLVTMSMVLDALQRFQFLHFR